jgi:phosphoribosylformylglycinamidine cyclo-ligase
MDQPLNYKNSGVDIDTANALKRELKSILKNDDPRVLNNVGAFGSLYNIAFPDMKDPVLVLKTEEPGSKQLLAFQYDRYESIGHDMINHLINDCIVMGARPLAVQDAIICGTLEKDKVKRMITGINEACRAQGCTLTGGEISEQPAVIEAGRYILTSSIVGIVDREKIIDGSTIAPGDTIIAVASSGLHTNGYSLVRMLLERKPDLAQKPVAGETFINRVLEPHRCYYTELKDLFPQNIIKGLAHITGGGIRENLDRILPATVDANIDLGAYRVPEVFSVIKQESGVDDDEMLRTFNLGVGLAVVCAPLHRDRILDHLKRGGLTSYVIGETCAGQGKVNTRGAPAWK